MKQSLLYTIILGAAFLLVFVSGEILHRIFKIKTEYSRKFVHIASGLLTLLFPVLVGDVWLVLLLCASFLILLCASLYFNFLPGINAVNRRTYGSLLYPVIVFICYVVYEQTQQYIYFYLPILIMAVCDPLAAFAGQYKPRGVYAVFGEQKSLTGSATFFIAAFLISFSALFYWSSISVAAYGALVLALITAAAEAVSPRGTDNFTIPLAALGVMLILKI